MTGTTTPAPARAPRAPRGTTPGAPPRPRPGRHGRRHAARCACCPGAGYLWTRRVNLGLAVLMPAVSVAVTLACLVGRDPRRWWTSPSTRPGCRSAPACWPAGWRCGWWSWPRRTSLARPAHRGRAESVLGSGFVLVLCLAVAAPVLLGARYAMVQADLVQTVFEDNESATVPEGRHRGGPVGRPRPGEPAAARRRRQRAPRRRPHRLDDPGEHRHPHRPHGDVQPAAQHGEGPVPRRTARCTTSTRRASPATPTRPTGCSTPSTDRCRRCTPACSARPTTRAPTR